MLPLASLLKSRRSLLGLSQVALAHASGVSLPTIQNLEAGKGNPSLQVLASLFSTLGLKMEAVPSVKADWDLLATLGVPISGGPAEAHPVPKHGRPSIPASDTASQLVIQLRLAALELHDLDSIDSGGPPAFPSPDNDLDRKKAALQATLLAIQSHYPVFYRARIRPVPVLHDLTPSQPSGKHIKLRRLALSGIARYL